MTFGVSKDALCSEIRTLILGGKAAFYVEVASDRSARLRGLMHRESLARCHGMWFDFTDTRLVSLWMKNTAMSLDVIFISEEMVVEHIVENTVPFSLDLLESKVLVRYALEVPSGTSNSYNVSVGDHVIFDKDRKINISDEQTSMPAENAVCALLKTN